MSQSQRSVFISYRHIDRPWALAIRHALVDRGFDVFLDVYALRSGDFEQALHENIRARAHFLMLLTPGALGRCAEPRDWLLEELRVALDARRNIVPVLLEGFTFSQPDVVRQLGEIAELAAMARYNAVTIPADYFDEGIEHLCSRYLSMPLDAVLHPPSVRARAQAASMALAAAQQPPVARQTLATRERIQQLLMRAMAAHQDPAESERLLAEAIQADPDFALPRLTRAFVRDILRHDSAGAIEDYTAAIRLEPQDARLLVLRAGVHVKARHFDLAMEDFDRACALDPSNSQARLYRGDLHEQMGHRALAMQDYDAAVRLAPRWPVARWWRAGALLAEGQPRQALEDLALAGNEAPDHEHTWLLRAQAHEMLGDEEAAAADRAWLDEIRRRQQVGPSQRA